MSPGRSWCLSGELPSESGGDGWPSGYELICSGAIPPSVGTSRGELRQRPGSNGEVSRRSRHSEGLLGRRVGDAVGVSCGDLNAVVSSGSEVSGPVLDSPAGNSKYDSISMKAELKKPDGVSAGAACGGSAVVGGIVYWVFFVVPSAGTSGGYGAGEEVKTQHLSL